MGEPAARTNFLLDTFSQLFLNSESRLHNAFKNVVLERIEFLKWSKKLKIFVKSRKVIPAAYISKLEDTLSAYLGLKVCILQKCSLSLSLPEIIDRYWDDIIEYVSFKAPSAKVFLKGVNCLIEDKSLFIRLKLPGKSLLKATGCVEQIKALFKSFFSKEVAVYLHEPQNLNDAESSYLEIKAQREKDIVKKLMESQKTKQCKVTAKTGKIEKPLNQVILGKVFSDSYIPISEINIDSGRVSAKGNIIKLETKKLKNGRILFIFDITDYTSSITVKVFANDKTYPVLKERLKKGISVKVRGDAQFDNFSKEVTLLARDIVQVPKECRMDNAKEKRVELHLHTQMSQMDAVVNVKDIVCLAAKWGHKALAITDHGVLQAFPEASAVASKLGLKIIYGLECYLLGEEKLDSDGNLLYKDIETFHAVILVKNKIGLKNLYRIVSESHLNFFYKKPRVPKRLLERYREGLIIGTACEAGELYRALLKKKPEEDIISIAAYYDYLEIQPLGNNHFLVENGTVSGYDELKSLNKTIVELGEKLNRPVVATCDVHFIEPHDEIYRRILQAGQGYKDAGRQAPLYFRTTKEMLEEFEYLGHKKAYEVVVENTNLINSQIEHIEPIPNGTFPPIIEGAEEDIKSLSQKRARKLYGDPLPEIVKERLDKELDSIIKNGFSVMYIIAQKLVNRSVEDGYLVGSRGSVGSSLVAYMTGITEVNSLPAHYRCENCLYSEFYDKTFEVSCGFDLPDKKCPKCGKLLLKDGYDIPFETFLGFNGDKEPDIDLNFSGEYQPKAHRYVEELFGKDHVFRAGTISTLAEKSAFGFVKSYINEMNIAATNAEINRLVSGCTGIKRTTGQHPGGLMVVPHHMDIHDFCPIQRPADDPQSDTRTTHFDYHSISGRILKLDILGHDDPTVIRMLQDLTGVDPQSIPIGEKRTMELFRSTEPLGVRPEDIGSEVGTLGIPEFGTKFVRQMLVDTKPTTFAELIRISGLSHGTDVWLNNAQELIKSGITTLANVISTRDDIMIFLIKNGIPPLTSFKIMEDVRKGRGLKPEYEGIMKEKGIPDWYIDSCKKIKYMFPKAHAAAYVMMAFRIAWFKVYYPKAFYGAYFTVRADVFDADIISKGHGYVRSKIKELESRTKEQLTQKDKSLLTILEVANEMYARGINCLPVDLYKSEATHFLITDEGLRPPLNALQGLGGAAAENIVKARREGKFLSIEDLKMRAGISKSVVDILEKHGCLKGLAQSSQISFF